MQRKRNLYLKTIPVEEAREKYFSAIADLITVKHETIKVTESLDRITGSAIYAKYSSPLYNASAMDGIAVRAADTAYASETSPVVLKETDYVVVDTGDPIHPPFDAVIMAEDIVETEDGVRIIASAHPWQHIRPIGEDIVAGEMILPGNHKIRAIDIGVLLSAGILEIEAVKRPEVAIFPTGTEIIEPEEEPEDGSIIESNSRMFENMVTVAGGIGHRFAPIADDYAKIRGAVAQAAGRYDMVIINAGSSAGTEDYTVHVLRELGEVIVHGVSVKPGKPVILAVVAGKPVIGLPGYPVSAYIGFENFVTPLIQMMARRPERLAETVQAHVSRRLVSSLKHKEYVRVKVGKVGDKFVAAPLARGAGAAMSLVRADGFCIIEQNSEGIEAGDVAEIALYRSRREIENTVVVIGSHDLILDVIADIMPNAYKDMFVSSTHVGSMGGLMALRRGEAHIAPIHLLDEESGEYNISYLKKMFREPMALIKGVHRIQGIMVKKDNPLRIEGLADLRSGMEIAGKEADCGDSASGAAAGDAGMSAGNAGTASDVRVDAKEMAGGAERADAGNAGANVGGVRAAGKKIDGKAAAGEYAEGKRAGRMGTAGGNAVPVRYVNRQRGAGTRVLFDYKLKQAGIDPAEINGYEREMATHMAVAAAVAGDGADAGMGVLSAAKAMGLDFIEIAPEEYDFAIPVKFLELPHIKAFLQILQSAEFHDRLAQLGGYDAGRSGEVILL